MTVPNAFGDEQPWCHHECGFRFELDGQLIDILAPDGLSRPPLTVGKLHSIQIHGGTQALKRTETVRIMIGDSMARVRRPTLPAAILLKARALLVHAHPADQRHDLVTLLGLLSDPRRCRDRLTRSEVRWLRDVEGHLAIDEPSLEELFDAGHLRVARAAYRILTA